MILFTAALTLMATMLVIPGWLALKNSHSPSNAVLMLPLLGIGVWYVAAAVGLGAQSLGNLIEVPAVALVSVLTAYACVILVRRRVLPRRVTFSAAFGIVVMTALALRLVMPLIPE